MSPILVACISLVLMLALIWFGMHVAVVLAVVSFAGVWLIKGDPGIAANLLAQASSDAIASHIFGVVPLATRAWKPEIAPQAIVMKQNGKSDPAKIGPLPSVKRVSAGRRISGNVSRMPSASAMMVPTLRKVER